MMSMTNGLKSGIMMLGMDVLVRTKRSHTEQALRVEQGPGTGAGIRPSFWNQIEGDAMKCTYVLTG
jgi:hypothetical protein